MNKIALQKLYVPSFVCMRSTPILTAPSIGSISCPCTCTPLRPVHISALLAMGRKISFETEARLSSLEPVHRMCSCARTLLFNGARR